MTDDISTNAATSPAAGSTPAGGPSTVAPASTAPGSSDPGAAAGRPRSMADAARSVVDGILQTAPQSGPPGRSAPAGQPDSLAEGDQAAGSADLSALEHFGVSVEGLPPELAGPLAEKLGAVKQWQDEAQQWAEREQARFTQLDQALTQQVTQIKSMVQSPVFQRALAIARNLQNGGAAGGQQPPEFETETERKIWESQEQLRTAYQAEVAAMRQQLTELRAGHESMEQTQQQLDQASCAADIRSAHKSLDAKYPQLAGDPKQRAAWHEETAVQYEASNGKYDLTECMERAAKILTYDHASKQGAANALGAARKAAQSSTLRGDNAADMAAAPRTSGRRSMVEIAESLEPVA